MFSKGQLIFAALFFVSFVTITIWSYRKELMHHKINYPGSARVLWAFALFIALLFLLKLTLFKR